MKIFRKKNNPKELPSFIFKWLLFVNQKFRQWALMLQEWYQQFSVPKKKWILAVFCLVFISESFGILYQSFLHKKPGYSFISIRMIPLVTLERIQSHITEKEFGRIHNFKLYVDSLQKYDPLRFDSLINKRPHLIDTLQMLEKIYYEQERK